MVDNGKHSFFNALLQLFASHRFSEFPVRTAHAIHQSLKPYVDGAVHSPVLNLKKIAGNSKPNDVRPVSVSIKIESLD